MSRQEEILFQGAKPYWRTRNTMDIMLVLHSTLDVIEVISYEPTIDKEAPRIYLKNSSLVAKLGEEEIKGKFAEAKETMLRRQQVPDNAALLQEVVKSSTTEYVLNRLQIAEFDAEKKSICMEMMVNFRDCADEHQPDGADASQIICAKPNQLQMFKSPHYQTLLDGLVDQMLESLRDDRTGIKMLRRRASMYESCADQIITNQERWRIPIIFVKVQNGRILTPADARVWRIVTRAIDTDVVTLTVAKVLDVKLADRAGIVGRVKSTAGRSVLSLNTNLSAINTILTKDGRTPTTIAATPKSRHHPGRSSFSDTSGVSGYSSPNISPTKRAQLNRAPTGMPRGLARVNTAASSNSLLAGITASMKKRFGMGQPYIYDEEGELKDKDAPDGDNNNLTRTSPSPQKLRGKPKAAAEPEFINPRGTNISITPKPRSFFSPPKRTKTARNISSSSAPSETAAGEAEEGKSEVEEEEDTFESSSISQRISAGFSAFSTSIKRTLSFKPKLTAGASQAVLQMHEGEEDSDEDVGFEKEGTVENVKKVEPPESNAECARKLSVDIGASPRSVAALANKEGKETKKVGSVVVNDSNKPAVSPKPCSVSPKTKKAPSPAPKVHSRIASMRSGATLDTARSTTSDAEALNAPGTPGSLSLAPPQTAEEFRDAMLKKQSTKTASAVRSLNSRASFRANMYGLEDSDGSTSTSPIAQFFSKMSPTRAGTTNRVLPDEGAEVEAANA